MENKSDKKRRRGGGVVSSSEVVPCPVAECEQFHMDPEPASESYSWMLQLREVLLPIMQITLNYGVLCLNIRTRHEIKMHRFSAFCIFLIYQRDFKNIFFVLLGVARSWWYPCIEASGQHKYSNNAQQNTSVVHLWYLILPLGLNPRHLRAPILLHSHGSGLISKL